MPESIESTPVEQLESVLLSSEFQWKLQLAEGSSLGVGSFGVDRSLEKVLIQPGLVDKFLATDVNISTNIISKIEENSLRFGSRTKSHIRRLVKPERTFQENYFGLLCGYYGIGDDTYSKLPFVCQEQGEDTQFFWSLGPYIAEELRLYGVQPTQVLNTITKWGNEARHGKHLPGISKYANLQAFQSAGFVLTTNGEDHSHQFARGIARILCSKQSVFKSVISKSSPMRIKDTTNKMIIIDEK